jgi:hypothetical protein
MMELRASALWAAGIGLFLAFALYATTASHAPTAPGVPHLSAPASTPSAANARMGGENAGKVTPLANPYAYIPAQCYTKTAQASGRTHNPCYVCHAASRSPNYIDDTELQLAYSFPAPARENHFTNLFVDRRAALGSISDDEIRAWVRADNYVTEREPPASIIPRRAGADADAYFNFDERGFDRSPDGLYSGWRAFAYYPFPGAFMPTNGSTDDVMVRLPEAFRDDEQGKLDLGIYALNLAVLETLLKEEDVAIDAADEQKLQVDLDGDGRLGRADHVHYRFARGGRTTLSWVGQARLEQIAGRVKLAPGVYPEGSELLHSVRYLDVDSAGRVMMARRMKELRYAKKITFLDEASLEQVGQVEAQEKKLAPDAARSVSIDEVRGAYTHLGWRYHALIEDEQGNLRRQSRQELMGCVGCHTGLGVTTDGTFALPRKLSSASAPARGWYHWSQKRLEGVPEPKRADGQDEYSLYLQTNGAGDELRSNAEVSQKFFDDHGAPRPEALAALHHDIAELLWPSAARALLLDKAYRLLVREQRFDLGRDPLLSPAENVHRSVSSGQTTGIAQPLRNVWERRE